VPPRRLRIEITETALMAGDYRVAATIEHLQALSIPLDIDDVGTGYSSPHAALAGEPHRCDLRLS
jgi:EAL domain-containing protein (putative c-di-GMP-specific phosphodiesterase class I)